MSIAYVPVAGDPVGTLAEFCAGSADANVRDIVAAAGVSTSATHPARVYRGVALLCDEIGALPLECAERERTALFLGVPDGLKTLMAAALAQRLVERAAPPRVYWFDCNLLLSETARSLMMTPASVRGQARERKRALATNLRSVVERAHTNAVRDGGRALVIVDGAEHVLTDTRAETTAVRTMLETTALPARVFVIFCSLRPPTHEISGSAFHDTHLLWFER